MNRKSDRRSFRTAFRLNTTAEKAQRPRRRLFDYQSFSLPDAVLEVRQLLSGADPNPPTAWNTQGTWGGGYQAEISVTNRQTTWVDDYQFQFDLADNITSMWGGHVVSHVGSRYTVAPDSWATKLDAGATAKFGFVANGTAGPAAAKVSNPYLSWNLDGNSSGGGSGGTVTPPATNAGVSVAYNVTSTWSGGFNGEIKITNTGTSPINGWQLKFDTTNTLTSVWNSSLVGASTGTVTIKDAGWNGTLAAGASATIGFSANGTPTNLPTNYYFNGVAVNGGGGSGGGSGGGGTVTPPSISTASASTTEGQSGTKSLVYSVNLSAVSTSTITVQYATSDISAKAGSDYISTSGTLTFAPGEKTKTISVTINGDTDYESDESFALNFSNAANATIGTASVTGTITNDDTAPAPPLPSLVIGSATATEGNSGNSPMVYTVTLSAAATNAITVNYSSADGTATAGSDYTATSGTLTFNPGELSKTITVNITGDTTYEADETVKLTLAGAVGATIATATGTGTIVNDDTNPTPPPTTSGTKQVVGYFAEWGVYGRQYNIADVPADKLTVLNYAFAQINASGEVDLYDKYAAVEKSYPGDTWDQPLKGSFNQIAKLKAANPNLKVVISVGGWTLSSPFSDIALTDASRKKFADSAVKFVNQYGFDGVDLDWEYPVGGGLSTNTNRPEDKHNYTLLAQAIRTAFNTQEAATGKHNLLTIAAPAGYETIANIELADMAKSIDWFNIMSYDYHGAWENQTNHNAPLYANAASPNAIDPKFNVDYSMRAYAAAGVPKSQIVMGAPLYGRTWQGVPAGPNGDGLYQTGTGAGAGTWENGVIDYADLLNKVKTQPATYKVYRDNASQVPYVYAPTVGGGWFSTYEDKTSLGKKVDYVLANEYGGMMFWELDADVRDSNSADSLVGYAAGRIKAAQPALPGISASDINVTEGNSGTSLATVTLSLSKASTSPITVNYATADGTATAGSDYVAGSGSVTFAPGETSKTVAVTINGDTASETDETFQLRLSNAANATLLKTAATVTIKNDDTPPAPPASADTAILALTGTWFPGFGGEITVKNTTGVDITNGWTLEFDSNFDITSIWNADIVSHVGTKYTVKSLSWGGSLAAGSTVKFGFNGSMTGGSTTPAISGAVIRKI